MADPTTRRMKTMASRLKLQRELEEFLGNKNVYFQPPESAKLKYPCIVYKHVVGRTDYADDIPYHFNRPYEITLITQDPDSPLVRELALKYPTIRQINSLNVNNRYHDIFRLYY